MISAGILKAVRLHLLPESYAAFAERAFYGTAKLYFSEGGAHPKLGGICLVGGLGGPAKRDGTPGYYYGEPVVENDGKGAAPFLLAYGELLRRSPDAVSGPRCIPNFAGGTLE
jgi:unsaturated rhamnogalacturonyl hydrolase